MKKQLTHRFAIICKKQRINYNSSSRWSWYYLITLPSPPSRWILVFFWFFLLKFNTFAGRNFRVFGIFSQNFLPGKKLNKKFAKVNFAKNEIFLKIIATKIEHLQKTAKVSSVNFFKKEKSWNLNPRNFATFWSRESFCPRKFLLFK